MESENQKLSHLICTLRNQIIEKSSIIDSLNQKVDHLSREVEYKNLEIQSVEQLRVKSDQTASSLLDKLVEVEMTLQEAVAMSSKLQKVFRY